MKTRNLNQLLIHFLAKKQHYFENKLTINDQEKLILERCPASEIETISLIGILLSHRTPINTFRLRIGSVFKSDEVLAQACQKMVSPKDITMAEEILFDWQYEYDEDIEIPIVDQYISLFKK